MRSVLLGPLATEFSILHNGAEIAPRGLGGIGPASRIWIPARTEPNPGLCVFTSKCWTRHRVLPAISLTSGIHVISVRNAVIGREIPPDTLFAATEGPD